MFEVDPLAGKYVIISFLLLSGCGDNREPCLGLSVGERLQMTIIGRFYGPDSPVECDHSLGLDDGEKLTATVTGYVPSDMNCRSASADFEPHDSWTWSYRNGAIKDGHIMGLYKASNGTCSGDLYLDVWSTALPSVSWQPDDSHLVLPAHLDIYYQGDTGDQSCPTKCGPEFGIDLRRL